MSPRLRQLTVTVPNQPAPTTRLVKAAGAAAVSLAALVATYTVGQPPDSNVGQFNAAPVITHNGQPLVDFDAAPGATPPPDTTTPEATTTTSPPTTTTPAAPAVDPTKAPAGAYPSPEEAARRWYAHRGSVPAEQVQVLQRDRRERDTFRVLVLVDKNHRMHSALLKVERVQGNYWRTTALLQQQEEG